LHKPFAGPHARLNQCAAIIFSIFEAAAMRAVRIDHNLIVVRLLNLFTVQQT
jgi:hypothetical protein